MTVTEPAAIIIGTVVKLPGLLRMRTRAMLTQTELAERAGLQRQTIGRLEQDGEASMSTVRKLVAVLGCTSDDLYHN